MKAQSTVQYATSTNNWRPPGLRQNYQEANIYQGLRSNDKSAVQQFSEEEKDLHPRLTRVWESSFNSKTNKIVGESQQSVPAIPTVITESRSFITNPQISSTHLNYSPASYETPVRPSDAHNRNYSPASGSAERYSPHGEPSPPHHVHTETTHDYGRFLAEDYRSKIEKEAEELVKRQKAHNSTTNGKSGPNRQQGYSHPKQGGSSYYYTGDNNDHRYSNNYNVNPHHFEVTSTEVPYHTPQPLPHSIPVTAPYSVRQPTVSPENGYSPYSHAPQGTSTPYQNLPQKYSNIPQQPSSPHQNLPSQYLNVPRQPSSPLRNLPSQYSSGPEQHSVTDQNMPSHYSN
ncbi:hypothetical protein X975_23209, partial [Stegodyphus mimosarum]